MRKIRILESGIQDLKESSKFYNQIPEGIGAYFIETAFAEIDSLSIHSGIHSKRFGFYRMLMKKFPSSIYYLIEGDVVVVFRILDCRKDPDKIRKALSDSSNFDPGPPQ